MNKFFTKEECIADAMRFGSKNEWKRKSTTIYNFAVANGYADECQDLIPSKRKTNWNFEKVRAEALKYTNKTDWKKSSMGSYLKATRNKWIDLVCGHMTPHDELRAEPRKWTKELCMDHAKNFSSKSEWRNSSLNSFLAAQRYSWFEECCNHMAPISDLKLSKKQCLDDFLKYKNLEDWQEKSFEIYDYSIKMHPNLMIDLGAIKIETYDYWTKDVCRKEALSHKTLENWKKINKVSYQISEKNGWVEDLSSHMTAPVKRIKWNKELCLAEALNYTTRGEWSTNSLGYAVAVRRGWLEECCQHMISKEEVFLNRFKHTKESCMEDAKQYTTRSEWINSSPAAQTAFKRGWFEDCVSHMPERSKGDAREKKEVINLYSKLIEIVSHIESEPNFNGSRPDILIQIKSFVIVIEVKHDESKWTTTQIEKQISKYETFAKEKYPESFHSVILTSPKGRYGISFKELIDKLLVIKESL